MAKDYDAIVIGGGHNGPANGACLAGAGRLADQRVDDNAAREILRDCRG